MTSTNRENAYSIDDMNQYEIFDVHCGTTLNGDVKTKEEGIKTFQNEGKKYGREERMSDPLKHSEQLFNENKDELTKMGGPMAERVRKIDELLKVEPIIDWKELLENCLNSGGLDPEEYFTQKIQRISSEWRGDRLASSQKQYRNQFTFSHADVFYLIDNSGSIKDSTLSRVFVEIFELEGRKDIKINNSALAYFATDIKESKIRTWEKSDDEDDKKLLIPVQDDDPSGGTDIVGSIAHVIQLDEIYDPDITLLIVMTDGEDYLSKLKPLKQANPEVFNKLFFIIMNKRNYLESIYKQLIEYGVERDHVIPVANDDDK